MNAGILPWVFLGGVVIGTLWRRAREAAQLRREFVETFTRPPVSTGMPTPPVTGRGIGCWPPAGTSFCAHGRTVAEQLTSPAQPIRWVHTSDLMPCDSGPAKW